MIFQPFFMIFALFDVRLSKLGSNPRKSGRVSSQEKNVNLTVSPKGNPSKVTLFQKLIFCPIINFGQNLDFLTYKTSEVIF